ncbi:MAG: hypothetical protein WAU45_23310 [Blastocatellia bacterium]
MAGQSISPRSEAAGACVQHPEWNKKMVKESNGPPTDPKSYKDMSGRELLLKIMELTAAKDITDYELQEILESIERILSERKTPGKQ